MRYIYFDPETKMGYSYEMTEADSEALGYAIIRFIGVYTIIAILTLIAFIPFTVVAFVNEEAVTNFVAVNSSFFIGVFIILLLIKMCTRRLSSTYIIRILFSMIVIIPILYFLYYTANMSDMISTILIKINKGEELLNVTTPENNWFGVFIDNSISKIIETYNWYEGFQDSIDYSTFSNELGTIRIMFVLSTVLKMILYYGLLALGVLLVLAAVIIVYIIATLSPYAIAVGVLFLVNNIIYLIKRKYVKHLIF